MPETEEACPLVVAHPFEEFGTRRFRHRGRVGKREPVAGHGDIVVQSVNVGGGGRQQLFRGGVAEG